MPSHKLKPKLKAKDKGSGFRAQGPVKKGFSFGFEAIGTVWEIEIFGPLVGEKELRKVVLARIEEFDKNYSRFREDSLVTKMSQVAGLYSLPNDAEPMMDMYKELYDLTGGLMTPLIGRALSEAGYDASYNLIPGKIRKTPRWEEGIEYRYPELNIKKPVLLDFGALGKGYLVDVIGGVIKNYCDSYVINAGGDIFYKGTRKIEIALENPDNTNEAIGIADIKNQAICGSAGNRRSWSGFNHILNPASLTSPDHIKAIWAVAETTMLADAMTTALYFASPAALLKRYTFSYGIIKADSSVVYSKDFPVRFFNESD